MGYYYGSDDEFYEELSEFDSKITEFKDSLLTKVKKEYVEKMKSLEKENEELQEVKSNWKTLEYNFHNKELRLELDREKLLKEVKRMRLSELMGDREVRMYQVGYNYKEKEKCDKCNKDRSIEFLSPTGKTFVEKCECSTGITTLVPREYVLYEFGINYNNNLNMFYEMEHLDGKEIYNNRNTVSNNTVYNDSMDYEIINKRDTYFKTKEDCQKYCDWLNEKEKNK